MKSPLSGWPTTDRERARATRFTFLLHLRPALLPARTLRWTHTFGLGGSSLVLLLLLAATGLLQMLVYQPAPDAAYDSVLTLEREVMFGPLVRGVHYWSANLLVLVALWHLGRVLFTGGHFGVRRFTWVLGCGLLVGILAASFSGYLLPWDQRSYWAVTISTSMLTYIPLVGEALERLVLGGPAISGTTLVNFYTLHTSIIPTLLLLVAAWHFWRVRRAGGVVVPPGEASASGAADGAEKVSFWPHLLVREIAQGLLIVALIVVLAAVLGAPLGERANPGMSPNPAKAPWYFMGYQELLVHFHPVLAVLVLPLLAGVGLLLLPYLVPAETPGGRWFLSARGRTTTIAAAILAAVVTPLLVVWDERTGAGTGGWLQAGVVPLVVLFAVGGGFAWLLRRRLAATRAEAVQAVTVLLGTAFVLLMVIGVWFRGAGMALSWPWTGGGG